MMTLNPIIEGQFDTFQEWINKASSWLLTAPNQPNKICVDSLGRRCNSGGDFQRARDEGQFPVFYFSDFSLKEIEG